MLRQSRTGIYLLTISILLLLGGCGKPSDRPEDSGSAGASEADDTVAGISDTDDTVAGASETDYAAADYEYYLTEEELLTDIEQGYIFRVDTAFKKPTAPFVSQGDWPFYVHEDNTVNLEVDFSNLLMKYKESIFPMDEQIVVEVISPDEQSVYRFEKTGDEITEDTSIKEQISVTTGEWILRISFAYVCGETPAHLKIAAAYETPSQEDMDWLKEHRLHHSEL